MSQADGREVLVVPDEPRVDFTELESRTRVLLLDAQYDTDFSAGGTIPVQPGAIEHQADYLLLSEEDEESRLVMARIGGRGLQVAMLEFSEEDMSMVPVSPDTSVGYAAGRFTCINFFSIDLAGQLQLEGVETLASAEEVGTLLETMENPRFSELESGSQRARYTPAALVLMEAAGQAAAYAERWFMVRKMDQAMELLPEDENFRTVATGLQDRLLQDFK